MDTNVANIFITSWNIYQKVFTYNYMRHVEMAAITRDAFSKISLTKALQIVDFGCGDAQPILPHLQIRPVAVYIGYDLSETALAFAKKNLAKFDFEVQLRQAPMQTFTTQDNEHKSFDVVHSSYAIHHLQDEEKQQLLGDCYSRLNQGGAMILIDVFRNEGQTRESFIEKYTNHIGATWQMISEDEQQQSISHMRNYDFPAYAKDMAAWAASAGFDVNTHRVDEFHSAMVLHKV